MIINLTQHPATPEQIAQGVVDVPFDKGIMTFVELPSQQVLKQNARALAEFAANSGAESAMIGGAPFFMSSLEAALIAASVQPVYAFSQRESVEKVIDGKTVKTNVFKHLGFVGV